VNRRASQNKAPKSGRSSTRIPPLIATSTVNHVFRYTNTTSSMGGPLPTTVSVSRAQLLNALIMNTSNSTTNFRITNAIKINRLSIWSPAALSGTSNVGTVTCSVEWLSAYGPTKIVTDTSMSPTFPAIIHSRPPPASLCGFWSVRGSNESEVMFNITSWTGSVVDLNVTYTIQDDTSVTTVSTTNSGAVGTVYATFLDGPRSSAVYQPIQLPFLN
jgi:hypothetical protein